MSTADVSLNYNCFQCINKSFKILAVESVNKDILWPQYHKKKFLLQLTSTVKLTDERGYDTQIVTCNVTHTYDVSLVKKLKDLLHLEIKHGVIDQRKYKKKQVNESGHKGSIMFRRVPMSQTNMLRCFVIKTSFHHCNFVVHTQRHMV